MVDDVAYLCNRAGGACASMRVDVRMCVSICKCKFMFICLLYVCVPVYLCACVPVNVGEYPCARVPASLHT